MPRVNLSDEERNRIKFLRKDQNCSAEQIRAHPMMLKTNGEMHQLKVIKHWVNRIDTTGDCKIAKRTGRPRLLNEAQQENLVKKIRENCKNRAGYSAIRRQENLFNMTTRTVNNYGLRNGFRRYRAAKKPPLSKSHISERKKFCEKWLQRPDDCKKLVIADEKIFYGRPTNNFQPVLRKKGERFDEEHIQPNLRPSDHSKCNVIVYIGPFGKGEVMLAEHKDWYDPDGFLKKEKAKAGRPPGFDGESYEDLLVNRLIPSIKERISHWIFLQDNASIHCRKSPDQAKTNVEKIFESENIELVKFPARSPDLTPIENVLSLLSREYSKVFDKLKDDYLPKNKSDTFRYVKLAWDRVENEQVKKIYFTFVNRLLEVRKIGGKNNLKL